MEHHSHEAHFGVIDCRNHKFSQAMKNQILQKLYQIGNLVQSGSQGHIFDITDLNCKPDKADQDLVVKFSSDHESIAYEIKVLHKIKQLASKDSSITRTGFPTVEAMGMFSAINLHQENGEENKDQQPKQDEVFGYYVMPKYTLSLQDFICSTCFVICQMCQIL